MMVDRIIVEKVKRYILQHHRSTHPDHQEHTRLPRPLGLQSNRNQADRPVEQSARPRTETLKRPCTAGAVDN
jgi:hypothetical protein